MKFLKTKILIIVFAGIIFPGMALGYFAMPDQYTHSMSFGVENENLPNQGSIAIPMSVAQPGFQADIQLPDNSQLPLSHNKLDDSAKNIIFSAFLLQNITWIIFICAVFIIVVIFILLKLKKVL